MTLAHRRELFLFVAWGIGVPWEAVSDGSRLFLNKLTTKKQVVCQSIQKKSAKMPT
jgi:nucleoside permease NupC